MATTSARLPTPTPAPESAPTPARVALPTATPAVTPARARPRWLGGARGAERAIVSRRTHLAGLGGAAALALSTIPGRGAVAASGPGADPSVITDWDATMVATIITDARTVTAEAFHWYALTQAAVYNAVVGITGRYELYKWTTSGPADASPQAAAAAAAHRILLSSFGYVPAARTRLADAYAASLAKVPSGAAKDQGVRYGERAADRILALRVDDGRFASRPFDLPLAPGVWRPTPTEMAPFFGTWLSRLRPMLLTFDGMETDWGAYNADPGTWGKPRNPDGTVRGGDADWWIEWRAASPPSLTSAAYAADFNEVKALGGKTSASRTPAQTETALFIAGIAAVPLQTALRDLVTRRGMDISDSARLLAAVNMSVGDSGRVTWDNKFHYGLWRPITAIRLADTDGNAATEADPSWDSLLANPPYPDYTSGLCSVAGSASRALARVLGTNRIDLYLTAQVAGTPVTRHYATEAALCQDAIDARVWGGIHFRFADVAGIATGTRVADWALDRYFQPRT